MYGPVITVCIVKYVWTSNYIVNSQECVDLLLLYVQSSMCGPVITMWTVKYMWASYYSVNIQVCIDQ